MTRAKGPLPGHETWREVAPKIQLLARPT
ncbi:hypothetical protein [Aquabacterium sp.]|nr:hypothetical protein [Aquabacterium sp.]HSW03660.1 hypothetical protein [Aquabacterium sp.]